MKNTFQNWTFHHLKFKFQPFNAKKLSKIEKMTFQKGCVLFKEAVNLHLSEKDAYFLDKLQMFTFEKGCILFRETVNLHFSK